MFLYAPPSANRKINELNLMYSALAEHVHMQNAEIEYIDSVIHFTLTQTKSSSSCCLVGKKKVN